MNQNTRTRAVLLTSLMAIPGAVSNGDECFALSTLPPTSACSGITIPWPDITAPSEITQYNHTRVMFLSPEKNYTIYHMVTQVTTPLELSNIKLSAEPPLFTRLTVC